MQRNFRLFSLFLGLSLVCACEPPLGPTCIEVGSEGPRSQGGSSPPSLTVTGFGLVDAAADTATLQLGIQTRGVDAAATVGESNAKVARVSAARSRGGGFSGWWRAGRVSLRARWGWGGRWFAGRS